MCKNLHNDYFSKYFYKGSHLQIKNTRWYKKTPSEGNIRRFS